MNPYERIIKHDLGSELEELFIIPLSDAHAGDKQFNEKEFIKTRNIIRDNDHIYTIINGDMMNTALKTSVSNSYNATLTPSGQIAKMVELLEPIKHKILSITGGNHEERVSKAVDVDITRVVCAELGILDVFANNNYILFISFGLPFPTRPNRRYTYSVYSSHGIGAGRLVGSKINNLERMSGMVDADIYLHSHTHTPATFKLDYIRTNNRTKTAQQVTKLFVNTSAWLNYGGYGERMGFKPATIAPVIIKMQPQGKYKYATCEL